MAKLMRPEDISHSSFSMGTDLVTSDIIMPDGYPKSIKCNPYNVGQMKKLVYAPDNKHYLKLMVGVLQECTDVSLEQLTVADLSMLILFMRVNSLPGDQGKVCSYSINCSKCDESTAVLVDLSLFNIDSCPKGFKEEREISSNITVHLPRVKTLIEQNEYDLGELTSLDSHIKYIKSGDTFSEKMNIYNSSSPEIISKIDSYIDEVSKFGVHNIYTFNCPLKDCGGTANIRIPFRQSFFLPDLV